MHCLPFDRYRFSQLIELINRPDKDFERKLDYCVCDAHFSRGMKEKNRPQLESHAVPDVNLPTCSISSEKPDELFAVDVIPIHPSITSAVMKQNIKVEDRYIIEDVDIKEGQIVEDSNSIPEMNLFSSDASNNTILYLPRVKPETGQTENADDRMMPDKNCLEDQQTRKHKTAFKCTITQVYKVANKNDLDNYTLEDSVEDQFKSSDHIRLFKADTEKYELVDTDGNPFKFSEYDESYLDNLELIDNTENQLKFIDEVDLRKYNESGLDDRQLLDSMEKQLKSGDHIYSFETDLQTSTEMNKQPPECSCDDINSTQETGFECGLCTHRCTSSNSLQQHLMSRHKYFECEICERRIVRNRKDKHMLTHANNNFIRCNKCNYKCMKKDRLRQHMFKHTSEKSLKDGVALRAKMLLKSLPATCIKKNDYLKEI